MERNTTSYRDFIVRVPQGDDISRLSTLIQSMGWLLVSQNEEVEKAQRPRKGLASLRGILETDEKKTYEELRREALTNKFKLHL